MSTDTHTIERERKLCAHMLDASECACESTSTLMLDASERTTRAARSLARSIARSMRERERTARQLRGYALMSARMLDAIERTASKQAREHGIDASECTARTLDAFAIWLGAPDRERATIESVRESMRHTAAIARRIARRIARKSGTGRGSMPRLDVSKHAPECGSECVPYCGTRMLDAALDGAVIRTQRANVATIDADTWREHYTCEHASESECTGSECTAHARRIERTQAIEHASMSAAHDRAPSESERDTIARTLDYERTPGAPDYPRWLDAFGHTAPSVGTAHPVGHTAPGVPHKHAPSMRRASMLDVARMLALDVRLLDAALDATRTTKRGAIVLDVARTQDRAHDTRHPANTRKHIERMLDAIAAHDREHERDLIALDADTWRGAMWTRATRHACTGSECATRHAMPIIESTYRGGIQLRAPHTLIYPSEHKHTRVTVWRDPHTGSMIESESTHDASECTACTAWHALTSSTAHAHVTWRESMIEHTA